MEQTVVREFQDALCGVQYLGLYNMGPLHGGVSESPKPPNKSVFGFGAL